MKKIFIFTWSRHNYWSMDNDDQRPSHIYCKFRNVSNA